MILVVDDKEENLFSLSKLLKLHGYEVDVASSGEDALVKVLKNSYALVILDVQMPVMDGFEVAETISGYSKSKDIPIIFLSAVNTDKRFISKGYASGGVDYVTKPVDPDILLLKVKTFVRLYEQTRELNEVQNALREEIEIRKKAERTVSERARELRSILESLPQIAFTATSEGEPEFVNKQWFYYARSAYEFPEVPADEESFKVKWLKGVNSGKAFHFEARIKSAGKDLYRCHWLQATPIVENNVLVKWVATLTDIEDRKNSERRKDDFISIASHELKTPLTSIKAYIQLLERMLVETDVSKETSLYISRASKQVDKLSALVADLLDISKIEKGKLEYNKKVFDFDALVDHAIEMIRETNKGFTIERKGRVETTVFGDEDRIEQVIVNYLTNAIKYSPANRKAEVVVNSLGDEVELRVKDFGIGIPQVKQQQVFQKFYRVEESSSRFQGLGIGLFICSEIIRAHDGQYGVHSEPGKGSEFYFTLPISRTTNK